MSQSHRVLIDPKCKELIKDLREVKRKRDTNGSPTGKLDKSNLDRTHLSDALSYLFAHEFPHAAVGGERPFAIV